MHAVEFKLIGMKPKKLELKPTKENVLLRFVCFVFGSFYSLLLGLFNGSRRLHRRRLFFYPLTGTEHESQPILTTRDRELVSVLEVRIEPGDLNPRPLTP